MFRKNIGCCGERVNIEFFSGNWLCCSTRCVWIPEPERSNWIGRFFEHQTQAGPKRPASAATGRGPGMNAAACGGRELRSFSRRLAEGDEFRLCGEY
jgi:hypothetical protein